MAMRKVSAKANKPPVEEKAPEAVETVNDGASDAPSAPDESAEDDKDDEVFVEPFAEVEPPKVEEVAPVAPEAPKKAKEVVAGPDGKVACKGLKTLFVGAMVRYEGQLFRQFADLAQVQADRGDLEILG